MTTTSSSPRRLGTVRTGDRVRIGYGPTSGVISARHRDGRTVLELADRRTIIGPASALVHVIRDQHVIHLDAPSLVWHSA